MIPLLKLPLLKVLAPVLGLLWVLVAVVVYLWARENARVRLRSTKPVSRPPAHAADAALKRRYLDLVLWALTIGFVPTYTTLLYSRGQTGPASAIFTSIGFVVTILAAVKGYGCMRTIRRLHLERQGRLLVGRLLEAVLPEEFRVFHDLFMETEENETIDHVVIGPTGIYAVTTWVRNPEANVSGSAGYVVVVDGARLSFPDAGGHEKTVTVAPIRDKGRRLKEWVAVATHEHHAVQPVLVLPGWEIQAGSNAEVLVLNENTLATLSRGRRVLQPTTVHDVARHLEHCCRMEHDQPQELARGSAHMTEKQQ